MSASNYRLAAGAGELQLTVASVTHVGRVRAVNEDAVLAEPPIFAVADGMGGHAFGDRASATAVETLAAHFVARPGALPSEPGHVLSGIRAANAAVRALTESDAEPRVIAGTTLAGIAVVGGEQESTPRWMVFNVGDSRVYRWSHDADADAPRLERISVDHSRVQELVDAGLIDEQQARVHPERNVITRALGAADTVVAEAWLLPAVSPQTFLICSDGLTKYVDDVAISRALVDGDVGGPSAVMNILLDSALSAGGADNVSIVVVESRYHPVGAAAADEVTRDREIAPELLDTRPRG
jgi:serine/threonine protein phosphatase PrpC